MKSFKITYSTQTSFQTAPVINKVTVKAASDKEAKAKFEANTSTKKFLSIEPA